MKILILILFVVACGKDSKKSSDPIALNQVLAPETILISCQHFTWCSNDCLTEKASCVSSGTLLQTCNDAQGVCMYKKLEIAKADLCTVNVQSNEHDFSSCN